MTYFSAILAIIKAIPALEKWYEDFTAFYIKQRIESMKKENVEAIKFALKENDQRKIEQAIGSNKAGELSGVPHTEIRENLPGVGGKQIQKTIYLIPFILLFCGCITRGQINAAIWKNNGLDPELCGPSKAESKNPQLWDYGFYRRLNNGKFEFLPFCSLTSNEFFAIQKDDLEKILNRTLPEK